jgi:hypothetical protein
MRHHYRHSFLSTAKFSHQNRFGCEVHGFFNSFCAANTCFSPTDLAANHIAAPHPKLPHVTAAAQSLGGDIWGQKETLVSPEFWPVPATTH